MRTERDMLGRRRGQPEAPPDWFLEYRAELRAFAREMASRFDAFIHEELAFANANVPPAAGGTVTDKFQPQILQPIIVDGLLVITQALTGPVVASSVVLTLGEHVIPIQNTTTPLAPLGFKVIKPDRQLVATYPAGAWTQGAYVAVWGRAAPASSAPGVLH